MVRVIEGRLICWFILLPFLAGLCACAPKKVRLYEEPSGLRDQVVKNSTELAGSRYKSGAKGPDAFDCSGLVYFTYRKSGISLPPSTEGLNKVGYEISRDNVLPGDLVFFKVKREFHVGIMINKDQFVHSSKSKGVAVDSLETPYWKKTFFAFRSVL
jgi:probable lipoprotein NlpC